MRLGRSANEEFLRGSKGLRLKPDRTQQPLYGASEARVILDNSDGALAWGHARVNYDPLSQTPPALRYCPFGQIGSLRRSAAPQRFSLMCSAVAPYRARVQPERTRRATRPPAPTRLPIAPPFSASAGRDAL